MLVGPTGVGKTEIARRLARLAGAPFVKVEASKFTEVGYVGRDVESMVRDLVESAINMVRLERETEVQEIAQAESRGATARSAAAGAARHQGSAADVGRGRRRAIFRRVAQRVDVSQRRTLGSTLQAHAREAQAASDRRSARGARGRNRSDAAVADDVRHDGPAGRARGNGQHLRHASGHASQADKKRAR